MTIGESLLPEYDMEMANTRKVLERVPDDKWDWKAHPKSNTIGWVAQHLAEIPGWMAMTLNTDSLDIAPPDGPAYRPVQVQNRQDALGLFDKYVAEGREALRTADDSVWDKPWSLLRAGENIFTMPKSAVVRMFVMNHMIHHRSHMCVYLRLNDIPVPALYGPSADEMG